MKNGSPLREFGSFFPLCAVTPLLLYSLVICYCSKEFGSLGVFSPLCVVTPSLLRL